MSRRSGRRIRAVIRRVPTPLVGLLVATAIFGVSWALVMPPWQGPDEIQHYSYVETLVERDKLPGEAAPSAPAPGATGGSHVSESFRRLFEPQAGRRGPRPVSSAVEHALRSQNLNGTTVGLAQPERSIPAFRDWLAEADGQSQSNGGGVFPGSSYPPLYYVSTALGYSAAGSDANAVDHLYATRLFSVLWLLATTVGVWLLAGELTNRHRLSQLVAAGAVALWPMLTFISSMVNPDAATITLWTWSFWLMARILRRGLTLRRGAAYFAVVALAILTKTISVALVPGAALVLLLCLWRARTRVPKRHRRRVAVAAAASLVVLSFGAWLALTELSNSRLLSQVSLVSGGAGNTREFLSYLWQYYLPRVPGQAVHRFDIPVISDYSALNTWIASGWAAYGWVTLFFPRGVYTWFGWITAAIGGLAGARLGYEAWRGRGSQHVRRLALPLAVALGATFFVLVLGLHIAEYRLGGPTIQGRYLFPMAAVAGLAVVGALRWVPHPHRNLASGITLGLLVAFQLTSLGYVAAHYYA